LNSPRRRSDRPIRSVSLKITFRGGREELARIKQAVPSAVTRAGGCEVRIDAEEPAEVAEKARALLEKLRAAP
jgi:hypothetical protein